MTKYENIKKALKTRLTLLSERAEDIEEDLSQPHDDDWSENATESEDEEVLSKIGNLAASEIEQIKMAINKIDNNSYGICDECKEEISVKRLAAVPHAIKCISCA